MTEEYKVRHTSVETIEELKRFRNSKYVQSRVGYAFQQVRNELKGAGWSALAELHAKLRTAAFPWKRLSESYSS